MSVHLPQQITLRGIRGGHVQGIATDSAREHMYFSFTTCLVKTDMTGRVIGSVTGLAGHLGCIAYCADDGRVWGSLEYKHDAIGQGILGRLGREEDVEDGFYAVCFDVDRIDRMDMDAEADGVMRAVYLAEVYADYSADGHRYGCSGIDGVTFAPAPAERDGAGELYVAYGIYGDVDRTDNDRQVLLRYRRDVLEQYARPLNQRRMHRAGPPAPDAKYFVLTGNTRYGIQNLEYDADHARLMAAVYCGSKPQFPNYPMYWIDLSQPPRVQDGEEQLALADCGERHEDTGIRGGTFALGATGMIALGGGWYYFSREFRDAEGYGSDVRLYASPDGVHFSEAKSPTDTI